MSERPATSVPPRRASAAAGLLPRLLLILDAIKFAHTLFALPFAALAGVWACGGAPGWGEILLLLAAMVSARTAAMAFNRLADASLDARNPRTRDRAIPTGRMSARAMITLCALSAAAFVASAAAFYPLRGNPWPAILCVPLLAVLLGYSYTKRFTVLSHWVLGLCLALGPVGVWIALEGRIDWLPVVLGAAVLVWTAGFDILYSLQDVEHDRELGLHSVPARFGVAAALAVGRVNHAAMVALLTVPYVLALCGRSLGAGAMPGPWYLAGLAVLAALLVYEHALVRADDLRRLNRAFFNVNASGSVCFALLAIIDAVV